MAMITSYELAEYVTCPRRAHRLRSVGCTTVYMATQVREYLRILCAFEKSKPVLETTEKFETSESLTSTIAHTHAFLHETKPAAHTDNSENATPAMRHAVISATTTFAAYVPLCTWNTVDEAWDIHFPSASAGLRLEHKIHATCALLQCEALNIPLAHVFLHSLVAEDNSVPQYWHTEDISNTVHKYREECKTYMDEMQALTTHADGENEEAWKCCGKRYCDICKTEQTYEQDDVRTLRKSKHVVDELLECGITRIQDIPLEIELHTSARRQVKAVQENRRLFFRKEIRTFLHKLGYPRYYLDFEGLSTTVPLFTGIKPGGFFPFLFSAQWQNYDTDAIHTQLWGMPPATDKRLAMWQNLKPLLQNAQSIIVYNRNFEDEMIRHLAHHAGEAQLGEKLTQKIVDLQELFFYLSLYDPKQKGKISLKTLATIWLQNDYSTYAVQDGMEANYFFTAMGDHKTGYFDTLSPYAYPTTLRNALAAFDNTRTISLRDIAEYCKYDTAVMIRLVSLLESAL